MKRLANFLKPTALHFLRIAAVLLFCEILAAVNGWDPTHVIAVTALCFAMTNTPEDGCTSVHEPSRGDDRGTEDA